MQKYFISVIIPALNEERSIATAVDNILVEFDNCGLEGEIIVINDGSTDRTPDLVKKKMEADKRVKMITHDKPMGIGASFWDGVDNANGDIVSIMPGDDENFPYEALRYVALLEHVDIVIPIIFNKNVRPLARNILSLLYLFIINSTFMTSFHSINSTPIYRRSVLKQLMHRDGSFFFQTDILIRAVKKGYLFAEVPYKVGIRTGGISKAVTLQSFLNIVQGYLQLVKDLYFSKSRGKDKIFVEGSATAKRKQNTHPDGLIG